MAEPEVLSHAKRRRCVLPVIQAIRSNPAFGQLYVMAIQARVNSPPIMKKKWVNCNPVKYFKFLVYRLVYETWLAESFLAILHQFHSCVHFVTFMFKYFFHFFSYFFVRKTVATAYASLILQFSFYSCHVSSREVLNCCLLPKFLCFEKIQKLYWNTVSWLVK